MRHLSRTATCGLELGGVLTLVALVTVAGGSPMQVSVANSATQPATAGAFASHATTSWIAHQPFALSARGKAKKPPPPPPPKPKPKPKAKAKKHQ